MFGLNALKRFLGPIGMMTMDDGRPDNSPQDVSALVEAYKKAREAKAAQNTSPFNDVFSMFPQQASQPIAEVHAQSPLPSTDVAARPIAEPQNPAAPQVPMPAPRPQEAPQAPQEIPWWQRNAMMQQDPGPGAIGRASCRETQ